IEPAGIARIVLEQARPQHVRHRCGTERKARMAAVRLLHRIHREKTHGVDAELIKWSRHGRPSSRQPSAYAVLSNVRDRGILGCPEMITPRVAVPIRDGALEGISSVRDVPLLKVEDR